jgi:hypothetical protein
MRGRTLLLLAVATLALLCMPACSSDARSSCDELRAELARVAKPIDVQEWNDITKLEEQATEAFRLRDEIAQRCD